MRVSVQNGLFESVRQGLDRRRHPGMSAYLPAGRGPESFAATKRAARILVVLAAAFVRVYAVPESVRQVRSGEWSMRVHETAAVAVDLHNPVGVVLVLLDHELSVEGETCAQGITPLAMARRRVSGNASRADAIAAFGGNEVWPHESGSWAGRTASSGGCSGEQLSPSTIGGLWKPRPFASTFAATIAPQRHGSVVRSPYRPLCAAWGWALISSVPSFGTP